MSKKEAVLALELRRLKRQLGADTSSDFDSSTRAQIEAMLIAGTNVTLTPAGSGATRTLTIAASGGGGTGNSYFPGGW